MHVGSCSTDTVLKSKVVSICSHLCKWSTSQRHMTICHGGLQMDKIWFSWKNWIFFPHCVLHMLQGSPLHWNAMGMGCLRQGCSLCARDTGFGGTWTPCSKYQRGGISVHPFKLCIMVFCQQRLYFLPCPDMLTRHPWHPTGPTYRDVKENSRGRGKAKHHFGSMRTSETLIWWITPCQQNFTKPLIWIMSQMASSSKVLAKHRAQPSVAMHCCFWSSTQHACKRQSL